MTIGFGLDLAGFTNDKSTVLVGLRSNRDIAEAMILQKSPFGVKLKGAFADRLRDESVALERLLKIGNVAVDVPIALQGLPRLDALEPWQLTRRPVDKVLDGLPPLASWLGACVARFAAIIKEECLSLLGTRLFETYPAASLKKMFEGVKCVEEYKLTKKEKREIAKLARQEMSQRLNIKCYEQPLSHDELDAVICAITAVAPTNNLLPLSQYNLPRHAELPAGYRILRLNPFTEIRVARRPYHEGLKVYEHQ